MDPTAVVSQIPHECAVKERGVGTEAIDPAGIAVDSSILSDHAVRKDSGGGVIAIHGTAITEVSIIPGDRAVHDEGGGLIAPDSTATIVTCIFQYGAFCDGRIGVTAIDPATICIPTVFDQAIGKFTTPSNETYSTSIIPFPKTTE